MIGDLEPSPHPSDLLARGEVHDFITATHVYERAIRHEMVMGEASLESARWWKRELWHAVLARSIYFDTNEESDAVTIQSLRMAGLGLWADAMQANDYRELAI